MERADLEVVEKAIVDNFEVRKLYEQHKQIEERLGALGRQVYLTPKEEQEERELKQRKLRGVERMLKLAQAVQQELAA